MNSTAELRTEPVLWLLGSMCSFLEEAVFGAYFTVSPIDEYFHNAMTGLNIATENE